MPVFDQPTNDSSSEQITDIMLRVIGDTGADILADIQAGKADAVGPTPAFMKNSAQSGNDIPGEVLRLYNQFYQQAASVPVKTGLSYRDSLTRVGFSTLPNQQPIPSPIVQFAGRLSAIARFAATMQSFAFGDDFAVISGLTHDLVVLLIRDKSFIHAGLTHPIVVAIATDHSSIKAGLHVSGAKLITDNMVSKAGLTHNVASVMLFDAFSAQAVFAAAIPSLMKDAISARSGFSTIRNPLIALGDTIAVTGGLFRTLSLVLLSTGLASKGALIASPAGTSIRDTIRTVSGLGHSIPAAGVTWDDPVNTWDSSTGIWDGSGTPFVTNAPIITALVRDNFAARAGMPVSGNILLFDSVGVLSGISVSKQTVILLTDHSSIKAGIVHTIIAGVGSNWNDTSNPWDSPTVTWDASGSGSSTPPNIVTSNKDMIIAKAGLKVIGIKSLAMTPAPKAGIKPAVLTVLTSGGGAANPIPSGKYPATSNSKLPWTPGVTYHVAGGIPARTSGTTTTITVAQGGSITSALSTAGSEATSSAPVLVLLTGSSYTVSGTLSIPSYVTLRGSGDTATILSSSSAAPVIELGTGNVDGHNFGSVSSSISGTTAGATSVTITGTKPGVGGLICIGQADSSSLIKGAETDSDTKPLGSGFEMVQTNLVTAVSGNTVSLATPLYMTFSSPVYAIINNPVTMAGVENLGISASGLGASSHPCIAFVGAAYCWVKDVQDILPGQDSNYAHVWLQDCFACEVRDSWFQGPPATTESTSGPNQSGADYGAFCTDAASDCLIENNVFKYVRHSCITEYASSGNVYGYNYSTGNYDASDFEFCTQDLATHGYQPWMFLYEGNTAQCLALDDQHGGDTYITAFRNWLLAWGTCGGTVSSITTNIGSTSAIQISSSSWGANLVGNVTGQSGSVGHYNGQYGSYSDGDIGSINQSQMTSQDIFNIENYDYNNAAVDATGATLPASLYQPTQPAWFTGTYPPIGPDVSGFVTTTPAHARGIAGTN
jgi:hypothetical protein